MLLSHVPRYLQVAAEERISIWSLTLDQERKDTKEAFVAARASLEKAHIMAAELHRHHACHRGKVKATQQPHSTNRLCLI